ncbi:hypothetical protein BDZ89DRAFT_1062162 [Hymenopellis radicata]|nr:hypothetical protein BDZ89DRAFT_1062162 [Hymenopellis radicata]
MRLTTTSASEDNLARRQGGMPGDSVAQEEDEGDGPGCGMGSGYVAMLVQSFIPSIARTPFVERFKYNISSNLLSTALSAHTPYLKPPTFPGTIATPSETCTSPNTVSDGLFNVAVYVLGTLWLLGDSDRAGNPSTRLVYSRLFSLKHGCSKSPSYSCVAQAARRKPRYPSPDCTAQ